MIFTWTEGRQNPYYNKMLLFKTSFMDCWLIKYAKCVGIGWHVDLVPGKRHYRLNIALINRNAEFWMDYKPCKKHIVFFRPDIQEHCVKVIGDDAYRLVLSIGWVLGER